MNPAPTQKHRQVNLAPPQKHRHSLLSLITVQTMKNLTKRGSLFEQGWMDCPLETTKLPRKSLRDAPGKIQLN